MRNAPMHKNPSICYPWCHSVVDGRNYHFLTNANNVVCFLIGVVSSFSVPVLNDKRFRTAIGDVELCAIGVGTVELVAVDAGVDVAICDVEGNVVVDVGVDDGVELACSASYSCSTNLEM